MHFIRFFCAFMLSLLLVACGGGESFDSADEATLVTPDTPTTVSYELVLNLNSNDGNSISEVTATQSGVLSAELKQNGDAFANQLITFSLAEFNGQVVGVLDPAIGTARTNSEGIAEIALRAGTVEGAGQVSATFSINDEVIETTLTFDSAGDETGSDPVTGELVTIELTVLDSLGNTFTVNNPVTQDNRGIVKATVTKDGQPLTSGLVSFETEFTGRVLSETGSELIDADGIATVVLSSGNLQGAGKVIAMVDGFDSSNVAFFYSSGDEAPQETAEAIIDIKLLTDCNENWTANRENVRLDPTDPATGCVIVNSDLSSEKLGTVYVTADNSSSGIGFDGLLVDAQTTIGNLSQSGKAITDSQGVALLTLNPGNANETGTITVTAKNVSASKSFTVGVADFSLDIDNGLNLKNDGSGDYQPLAAGATTVITVDLIEEDGTPLTVPLNVEFSSNCAQAGSSELDTDITSIGGKASATYRSLGCNGNLEDTVTAFVNGKSITTTLPLSSASVSSIEFINSSSSVIALKGTGGQNRSESSNLTFRLKDELGLAVSNSRLDFKLNSYNGGAKLSLNSVNTNSDGLAEITVTSGSVPMTVRAYACFIPNDQIPANYPVDDITCWKELFDQCQADPTAEACPEGELSLLNLNAQIISVSDMLTITSGLPDNDSFTLSAATYNVEALSFDGEISNLTLYMADHFGNFVPDGTSVYLRAESGAVGLVDGEQFSDLLRCETIDGQCTVQWRSQNPRTFTDAMWNNTIDSINPKTNNRNCDQWFGDAAPCINGILNANNNPNGVPLGGRATVLATAIGEESFIDRNGNGVFDSGEFYASFDLSEAFIDHNENGVFDGNVDCSDGVNCQPDTTNGGEFEEFVDFNNNGEWDSADGKFNGLVCSEAAEANGDCSKDLVDLRQTVEIVMSGSTAYGRYVINKGDSFINSIFNTNGLIAADCSSLVLENPDDGSWAFADGSEASYTLLDLEVTDSNNFCDVNRVDLSKYFIQVDDDEDPTTPVNCDRAGAVMNNGECEGGDDVAIDVGLTFVPFTVFYSDIYNNPLPAGTEVEYSTTNGATDSGNFVISDNVILPKAASSRHIISREGSANNKISGEFIFKFKTPKGVESNVRLTVSDEG